MSDVGPAETYSKIRNHYVPHYMPVLSYIYIPSKRGEARNNLKKEGIHEKPFVARTPLTKGCHFFFFLFDGSPHTTRTQV